MADSPLTPAVVDGVIFRRSFAKTAGLIALNGVGFFYGFLFVRGWFQDHPEKEMKITWWGLLVGFMLVMVTPVMVVLLVRSLWVNRRLIVGVDRVQLVERLHGEDVVVLQIPYDNIAELKHESEDEFSNRVGIDLRELDDPDTYAGSHMFLLNKQSDGRHFCIKGGYSAKLRVISKTLEHAYEAWADGQAG